MVGSELLSETIAWNQVSVNLVDDNDNVSVSVVLFVMLCQVRLLFGEADLQEQPGVCVAVMASIVR